MQNDYSDILLKNVEIVKGKAKQYGNTYKKYGDFMKVLFPKGLIIQSKKEWERFGVFNMICHKLLRITNKLFGDISLDNITDLCNYAAMLEKIIKEEEK